MPPPRVVIFIRPNELDAERQQQACLLYCERHRYSAESICFHADDAVSLVASSTVEVVVTAYDGEDDLERRVREAGGRVEYVRPSRRGESRRLDAIDVIAGMHERGADVPTIAHLLDLPTGEIRTALERIRHIPRPR